MKLHSADLRVDCCEWSPGFSAWFSSAHLFSETPAVALTAKRLRPCSSASCFWATELVAVGLSAGLGAKTLSPKTLALFGPLVGLAVAAWKESSSAPQTDSCEAHGRRRGPVIAGYACYRLAQ